MITAKLFKYGQIKQSNSQDLSKGPPKFKID